MKIKTSELTGAALDWAVTKCEGIDVGNPDNVPFDIEWRLMHDAGDMDYSTDWSQGGPIIEREKISFVSPNKVIDEWEAIHPTQMHNESYGATPLIAAMRCYVASKLGDEVDVPDDLI